MIRIQLSAVLSLVLFILFILAVYANWIRTNSHFIMNRTRPMKSTKGVIGQNLLYKCL